MHPDNQSAATPNQQLHLFAYIILAILILLNIPLFVDLAGDWVRDGNYSHGFFVIPISVFLFYQKRKELIYPAKSDPLGLAIFIFGCLGLIFGTAASEFFTLRFSFVLALTGLGLYHLGRQNFRKVWLAFAFLLFMIPIPAVIYYSATLPMQLFATKITSGILHLLGVPSLRQGNIIYLPAYSLEVTEACSGLRSLITLMALGALFGNLTLPGKIRPLILFLAAIPIAVIVNIIRLLITAVGAYAISPKIAESFLHELSGILVFVIAIASIIALAGLLRWKRKAS